MKKSLIAAAALALLGTASAQSSVTLYGVLDIGYGSHETTTRDGSGTIRTTGVMDGSNVGQRIGFRGSEDLGGGLRANFVIEQGISATNGSLFGVRAAAAGHMINGFSTTGSQTNLVGAAGAFSTSTNRQSYVGLASSTLGTVNIGYHYTVVYQFGTFSGYNIGSEGLPGADKAHLHGQVGVGGTRSNQIAYISPEFGGFTTRLQYGAGTSLESIESNTPQTNGLTTDKVRRLAAMLQYANGPLSAAIGYTNLRSRQANINPATGLQLATGATTSVYGVTGAAPAATAATLSGATRSGNLLQLGGSYDFGVAKVGGTLNRGKNGGLVTSPAGSPNGTPGFNYDYRAFQVGVSVPFGAFVPFVTIGRATTDSSNPAGVGPTLTAAATKRIEDYRSYQVGVRYSLSKRTTAYMFYGETRNDAAALAGSTSFYKDRKTVAGLAHSF